MPCLTRGIRQQETLRFLNDLNFLKQGCEDIENNPRLGQLTTSTKHKIINKIDVLIVKNCGYSLSCCLRQIFHKNIRTRKVCTK